MMTLTYTFNLFHFSSVCFSFCINIVIPIVSISSIILSFSEMSLFLMWLFSFQRSRLVAMVTRIPTNAMCRSYVLSPKFCVVIAFPVEITSTFIMACGCGHL